MAGSPYKNRLSAMNKEWKNREEVMSKVPDGEHIFQLQEAELGEAQTSGKLRIKRVHTVADGELKGETITDFMSLETEKGPYFVGQWIEQMGYDIPARAEDLPDVVAQISQEHPTYIGQVKTSGDFKNVRVQELVDLQDDGEEEGKAEDEPEAEAESEAEGEDGDDNALLAEGDTVAFKDDEENEHIGTFTKVDPEDEEMAKVDVDGEEWTVPIEGCEPVEVQEEEPDPVPPPKKAVKKPAAKKAAKPAAKKPAASKKKTVKRGKR